MREKLKTILKLYSRYSIIVSLFYNERWEANQLDHKATILERLSSLLSAFSQPLAAATNQFTTPWKEENYSMIISFSFYQSSASLVWILCLSYKSMTALHVIHWIILIFILKWASPLWSIENHGTNWSTPF